MNKLIKTIIITAIMYVLPLSGEPARILDIRILVLMGFAALLLMTQPELSVNDSKTDSAVDRYSIAWIVITGALLQVAPVVEWGYLGRDISNIGEKFISCIGLILLVGGISFRIWAIRTLKNSFTATVRVNDDQKLITKGPYGIVRHPSYLGAYTAMIGAAAFLNSIYSLAAVTIVMFFVYRFRIEVEERAMIEHFGDEYIRYRMIARKRMIPEIY